MPILRTTSGIGFPSCNRALSRIPRNTRDPQGYYKEIGVEPWASEREIRRALRQLYRTYHTDGSFPDERKFRRIKAIGLVLLDPEARAKYNRTPPGKRGLDAVYQMELKDAGSITQEMLLQMIPPQLPGKYFDFYTDGQFADDLTLANEWYRCLVSVAPAVGYAGVIRVLIRDDDDPAFAPETDLLMIPRHWVPSETVAFALMRLFVRRVA